MVKGINMKPIFTTCALLGLLVVLAISTKTVRGDDISCTEALTRLLPCREYLVGSSPSPSGPCCVATQTLNNDVNTPEIRRALCGCLKQAAPSLGVTPERAADLPKICNVPVPVPIDPNVDCSKIN